MSTEKILPGTPEFLALPQQEQEARIARILDRASQVDRLYVELPDHLHGEWITDDPVSMAEAQRKGFVVDEEYAAHNSVHGTNKQGDAIFMTMPKYLHDMYRKKQAERYEEEHGKKGKDGKITNQSEDIEFGRQPIGLPAITESQATEISGTEIANVLSGGK